MENENVSLPSAMSRARATFSDLSRSHTIVPCCLFLSFSPLPPLLFSSLPSFIPLAIPHFSPLPNMNVYTTYFSRINRPDVHTHAHVYVRINDERNVESDLSCRFVYTSSESDVHCTGKNDFSRLRRTPFLSCLFFFRRCKKSKERRNERLARGYVYLMRGIA